MRRHGWVKPLIDINCQYAAGDYPLIVRINFENGVTRRYRDDDLHLPPPIFDKPGRGNIVVGYQYQGHKKAVTGSRNSKSRQRNY